MPDDSFFRLRPDLEIVAREMADAGWEPTMLAAQPALRLDEVRLYGGQQRLRPGCIYILDDSQGSFPDPAHPCISACRHEGLENLIWCPGKSREDLLDFVQGIFERCRGWEREIDEMVYHNVTLDQLCDLGARLLGNPVCIHDDWFIMIAMSRDLAGIMEPEYVMTSDRGFIPRAIVDDFKYDSQYLETYAHRDAQLWEPGGGNPASLYVNLWEGSIYRGRLLAVRSGRDFTAMDFQVAQLLTQAAKQLLLRQRLSDRTHPSMDDIVFRLLQGGQPDPADLARLMNQLSWNSDDCFACVQIRGQEGDMTGLMEHVLHSDLFQIFPGSYILLWERQQCLILNLTSGGIPLTQISHYLAPLCRDYCLYAGISSPVMGIRELHVAYYQAEAALNRAFALRGEKWMVYFSQCAMDHMLDHQQTPLSAKDLVSPSLLQLLGYDSRKQTQYYETLRAYLILERDIPKTAQHLIIHRTTLLYRLKKIQSLLNLNLEDPQLRLYLLMSVHILDRERQST